MCNTAVSTNCSVFSVVIFVRRSRELVLCLQERKKRPREESSLEDGSVGEESCEVPAKKPALAPQPAAPEAPTTPSESAAPTVPTPSPQAESANQQPASAPEETGEGGEGQREPRTCVLRQRQEKNPLYKLLDHLLKVNFRDRTFLSPRLYEPYLEFDLTWLLFVICARLKK